MLSEAENVEKILLCSLCASNESSLCWLAKPMRPKEASAYQGEVWVNMKGYCFHMICSELVISIHNPWQLLLCGLWACTHASHDVLCLVWSLSHPARTTTAVRLDLCSKQSKQQIGELTELVQPLLLATSALPCYGKHVWTQAFCAKMYVKAVAHVQLNSSCPPGCSL